MQRTNSTCIIIEHSTELAALESHGHREDKTTGMSVHLLGKHKYEHIRKIKNAPHALISRPHDLKTNVCHTRYQEYHGNLYEFTYYQLRIIIFIL